jgi:two-component system cell cycle sensor histidine kinase/response regulator CckA
VVCSDYLLHFLFPGSPSVLWSLEVFQGVVYIAVTAGITGLLVRDLQRESRRSRIASESKLRSLESAGLIGIFTWRKGLVTNANEAFLKMTGHSREDVVQGKLKVSELASPEYRLVEDQVLLELADKGTSRIYQQELLARDGSRVMVIGGRALIKGDPDQGIGYALDITPVVLAEKQHKDLVEQLQSAHRLNALGQVAGSIAHDFNNLLGVIVGYTAMMQNGSKGNPSREEAAAVLKAAEKARALARKLLAFSRKQSSHPELLDVNDVLQDFEKMLRCVIGDAIELQLLAGDEVGSVLADSTQLEQVVMNLVVNARDAMPRGGLITIETQKRNLDSSSFSGAEAGVYVSITVRDTGTGISKDVRDRIFEPFFSTKKDSGGTGLGLAIVDDIVRQSGGHITCNSEPGRGTEFTILLPWAGPRAAKTKSPAPVQARGGSETILLIEDGDDLRGMLTQLLTSLGYTVLPARDGQHGVDIAQQYSKPIHLVLADIAMPRLSGPEAVARIRRDRPDVKVVFLTGFADPNLLQGISLANVLILEKPFTPDDLALKIRDVLSHRAAA